MSCAAVTEFFTTGPTCGCITANCSTCLMKCWRLRCPPRTKIHLCKFHYPVPVSADYQRQHQHLPFWRISGVPAVHILPLWVPQSLQFRPRGSIRTCMTGAFPMCKPSTLGCKPVSPITGCSTWAMSVRWDANFHACSHSTRRLRRPTSFARASLRSGKSRRTFLPRVSAICRLRDLGSFLMESNSNSSYNSLQATVNKRLLPGPANAAQLHVVTLDGRLLRERRQRRHAASRVTW